MNRTFDRTRPWMGISLLYGLGAGTPLGVLTWVLLTKLDIVESKLFLAPCLIVWWLLVTTYAFFTGLAGSEWEDDAVGWGDFF